MTGTPSPLQALQAAIASGEITPKAATQRALDLANSNTAKNVYISHKTRAGS